MLWDWQFVACLRAPGWLDVISASRGQNDEFLLELQSAAAGSIPLDVQVMTATC